ncbi:SIMPL domain-containing protein [Mycoplasmatota bacterium]|nr:SIMPL domain-containing protein [Mycoplasmatota bacterium]
MRILKVKGVGKSTKTPDSVVILFKIISKGYDYDKVINDLNERTAILRNDIVKAGFAKEDLKTTNFTIDTEYKYKDGENIFTGYKAVHELKLEFDFNQIILNNLLRTLSTSEADPEYKIVFEVKDKRAFKDEILVDAVNNAKQNASVISNAASVKLGKIMNIDYDYRDIVYRSGVVLEKAMLNSTSLDIYPEDVTGTDTVFIEWEIEDNMI